LRFNHAIVRTPGKSLINGITRANLGKPDYRKALTQHVAYIKALRQCGLQVRILPPSEEYPDSTFIEDTALLTPDCAIITNPGAISRRGEIHAVKPVLQEYYSNIEEIQGPGTVEAGDIMMMGTHFFIGLSERTNKNGADQVIRILNKYGMSGSVVGLKHVLHLKTGIAYLENHNFAACGEFVHHPDFQNKNILEIDGDESYAANCVWINGRVLIPDGFPKAMSTLNEAGYETLPVDVSEFQKLDGGLSCLSLRF
jgi:dimethylargininase